MNEVNLSNTATSIWFIYICTYLWISVEILWLYTLLLCIDFLTGAIKWITFKNFESNIAINWMFKKLILILLIFSIWATWKIVWYKDLRSLLSLAFS